MEPVYRARSVLVRPARQSVQPPTRGTSQVAPVIAPKARRQFDPLVWKSEPPVDCPFEMSAQFNGVEFLGVHSDYRLADTWYPS